MPFVTRAEWGARSGRSLSPLQVSTVAVHWGGGTVGAIDHSKCAGVVRSYQAYHLDGQGWADIAYNLLVCQHGYVYEGRGVGKRSAANGDGPSNSASYAICYIGGAGDPFTDAGKNGINDAAELLVPGARKWTVHSDWTQTGCPGETIRSWVGIGHPRSGGATPKPKPVTPKSEEDIMFSTVSVRPGEKTVIVPPAPGGHLGEVSIGVSVSAPAPGVAAVINIVDFNGGRRPIAFAGKDGVVNIFGRIGALLGRGDWGVEVENRSSLVSLGVLVEARR